MRSGRQAGDALGRSDRKNADGSPRVCWVASKEARQAGYKPKTVRIHETDETTIEARCKILQAEMLEWLAGRIQPRLTGTVNALVREYRTRPESPYFGVKWNTRRTYDKTLDKMERAFGKTALSAIKLADMRRWYDATRYPDGKGRDLPDYVRTAHALVAMLRRIARFGVAAEIDGCERIATILANAQFQAPRKRTVAMEAHHIAAFRKAAHGAGRPSLAIGTALQWELMLRQRDVIGEWEPFQVKDGPQSAYVINGRQWVNGLTWSDVSPEWIVTKRTTKTGAAVAFDLTLCPIALDELMAVPEDRRFGPIIVDENADRPYAEHAYHREWRRIANLAGVPSGVWNMDARAGGATEAGDAGADLSDIRPTMGHSRSETTARYIRGTALEPARRVATLRVAHRGKAIP